jgi:hypothetical protein
MLCTCLSGAQLPEYEKNNPPADANSNDAVGKEEMEMEVTATATATATVAVQAKVRGRVEAAASQLPNRGEPGGSCTQPGVLVRLGVLLGLRLVSKPQDSAALLLCCSAALLLCCSAALLLCCSAALLLCCSAALLQPPIQGQSGGGHRCAR